MAIDTFRVVCDFPVAYSFVNPGTVDGKIVGLLGTLTSLIGIYQNWNWMMNHCIINPCQILILFI